MGVEPVSAPLYAIIAAIKWSAEEVTVGPVVPEEYLPHHTHNFSPLATPIGLPVIAVHVDTLPAESIVIEPPAVLSVAAIRKNISLASGDAGNPTT